MTNASLRRVEAGSAIPSTVTLRSVFQLQSVDAEGHESALRVLHSWVAQKLGASASLPTFSQNPGTHVLHSEPAATLTVQHDDGDTLVQLDQRDQDVQSRVWTTSARVNLEDGAVHVAIENGFSDTADRGKPYPTVPLFMRNFVHELGARDGPLKLTDQAMAIATTESFGQFEDAVLATTRQLPILVLTPLNCSGGYSARPLLLARHLLGVAHVMTLDELATSWLHEVVGEACRAYNGALRLYRPGAGRESRPDSQPLLVPPRELRSGAQQQHAGFERFVLEQAYALTRELLPPLPRLA